MENQVLQNSNHLGGEKAMYQLSPSILACDFTKLGEQVQQVKNNGVKYLHFDVMDGSFVPNISIGLPVLSSLKKNIDMFYDVHLMIDEPIKYVKQFSDAGADLINIHIEACKDVKTTINEIKKYNKKVGITVKPKTSIEDTIPYLKEIDMVLVMTVEPGFGGQSFMTDCLDKVKFLKNFKDEHNLDFDIQVDGGVSDTNIQQCIDAGANIFVVGTKVFAGDIDENCRKINNILDKYN